MLSALKREWMALKGGSPGRRFQDRYVTAKKARKAGGWKQHGFRAIRFALAAVSLVVGMVLMFIPGPAILFYFVAGGLLASESKLVARFLDWSEVRLRTLGKWGARHWEQLSVAGKMAILTFVFVAGAGAAFGMYRFMAG